MKMTKACLCMLCGLLVLSGPAALGEDFDSVEKSIVKANKKTKSLSATNKSKMNTDNEGYKFSQEMEGPMEWRRDGEKFKMRMESTSSTTTETGGKVTKSKSTSLMIDDGEFMYSYTNMDGQKSATKSKSTGAWDQNPFEAWRKMWDFKLLSDESVDGASCYVIEFLAKSGSPMSGKMVLHYRKDCGLNVKTVIYDKDGKVTMTSTSTDVKVNPSLGDDRFVFKAPAGVEVVDMTQEQQVDYASDEPADKADAEKKPEKKAEAKKPEKKAEAKKPEKKKKGLGLPKLPKWKKKP